jgi:tetratricopeptide (TPR) repeat protein
VLLLRGRAPDAEAAFRAALAIEPNNEYALSGLERLGKVGDELPASPEPATHHQSRDQSNGPKASPKAPGAERGTQARTTEIGPRHPERIPSLPVPEMNRGAIEILANDAFLVRGWARRVELFDPEAPQGRLRDRARSLLTSLLPDVGLDSVAAGASGLLELDDGELVQALELLRQAAQRFPGSARVRYALARAEREAGTGDPLTPWRRLLRLDGHYEPIYFLGGGRASLNRLDAGDTDAEKQSRQMLGQLAFWLAQRIEPNPKAAAGTRDARQFFQPRERYGFAGWWAREVEAELFDLQPVAGWDDLADLETVRERAQQHAIRLDRLEEELVVRYASA